METRPLQSMLNGVLPPPSGIVRPDKTVRRRISCRSSSSPNAFPRGSRLSQIKLLWCSRDVRPQDEQAATGFHRAALRAEKAPLGMLCRQPPVPSARSAHRYKVFCTTSFGTDCHCAASAPSSRRQRARASNPHSGNGYAHGNTSLPAPAPPIPYHKALHLPAHTTAPASYTKGRCQKPQQQNSLRILLGIIIENQLRNASRQRLVTVNIRCVPMVRR